MSDPSERGDPAGRTGRPDRGSGRCRRVDRRWVLGAGIAGLAGLAGCTGGGSGDGGDGTTGSGDGGSGDGGPRAVVCTDLPGTSTVAADVAGTAIPCRFDYPEPATVQSRVGDPAGTFIIQMPLSAPELAEGVQMTVQLADQDELYTEDQVTGDRIGGESTSFGDRTAYLAHSVEPSARLPSSIHVLYVPVDRSGSVRYHGVAFSMMYASEEPGAEDDPPADCLSAIVETNRTMAETATPNPDSEFESTLEIAHPG